MYGSLDISTSGMIAQRTRMNAIAANIANRGAILDAKGNVNPYRARHVHFAAGDPTGATPEARAMGVHVAKIELDDSPPNLRWDPGSPYAYKSGPKQGWVPETNVNPVVEQINALDASRAYEANVVAAEAAKTMMAQALRLIA
jgi:flagellar basal-body rod protein FlgC